MKTIVEEFELEFDGIGGYTRMHKREIEKIQFDIAALRAENAKLRGTLNNLLTNCELGHWSKYVREILAQIAETNVTPDPLYAAAPEMLELLEDISAPRRGTEAENWQVDPRVIQLAARIVDKATFNPADLDEF